MTPNPDSPPPSESEERFRQVAENIPQALLVRDANPPRLLYISPGFDRIWGRPREQLFSRFEILYETIHPDDRDRAGAMVARASQGEAVDFGYRIFRPSGEVRHLEIRLRPLLDPAGTCYRVVGIVDDVTERKLAADALRQVNERLSAALAESEARARENDILTELVEMLQSCQTMDEACQVSQAALQSLFGALPGALCMMRASRNVLEAVATWGVPLCEPLFAPEECWALRRGKAFSAAVPQALRCRHVHGEVTYVCMPLAAQGDTFGLLVQAIAPGAAAAETQVHAAGARIALALANVRLREVLRNQSIRDPLTGLYNRRYMEATFERELERAAAKSVPLTVAMLDLDHFKRFNDTYGHNAGDLVLREVAEVLRTHVRRADCACRYGGEEFVLLFHEAPLAAAMERLEALRAAIKALAIGDRGRVFEKITISAGVATFPTHGAQYEALIKAADTALYQAKQNGRDRIEEPAAISN